MLDLIKALPSSLPGILAFAGVLFIFLSMGGKLGAQLITDNISKRYAGIVGVIFLLSSLALFIVSRESRSTGLEISKDPIINSGETYTLRPKLPMNQPISQVTDIEWEFSSADKSTNCSFINHKEYAIVILGRDTKGEPSVAKRKTVSDISTSSCKIAGKGEPEVANTRGELEGKDLLAHRTAEGLWIFDDPTGFTEKQKKAMRSEGFMDPFSGYPHEKVAVGKVITFKDEELSLVLGTTFPGKKEGTVAILFEHVILDREPVAQLKYSMNMSGTTLDENDNEFSVKMSLNGGGRLSLSENPKINSTSTLTGIITLSMQASPGVVMTGPATMKIFVKEL
jgi:hypothetical protein